MFDAIDVARHLIRLGYDPECPDESVLISPLRLQKLLYYCQGWSLALLGKPLFREELEAWRRGPVVNDVYERFKGTRDGLTPGAAGGATSPLSGAAAALVESVWREYAKYTPEELCEMTHGEPAWAEARGGLPPEAQCDAPLSRVTMERYFREESARRVARGKFPLLKPDWSDEPGPGVPADEVFGRLLAEAGN